MFYSIIFQYFVIALQVHELLQVLEVYRNKSTTYQSCISNYIEIILTYLYHICSIA